MPKTKNAIQVKYDDFKAILEICGSDFLIRHFCPVKNFDCLVATQGLYVPPQT